jgi:ribose transport system ATP-binding protein
MSDAHTEPAALLRLHGITKSFPGVVALNDVNLTVLAGEVHALVGENGAGKSTLMGVAAGSVTPDAGVVEIGGVPLPHLNPTAARAAGLAIVRQDHAQLPDLTVAENMFLGVRPALRGGLRAATTWAAELLEPWQMGIDPRERMGAATMEQRSIVEIATALALRPRVLVLDEPSEHLSAEEVERLFQRVGEVTRLGGAVVYISHRIPEVKSIAGRVTVLRDGQVRGTFDADAVSEQEIVTLVVGRSLDVVFPAKAGRDGMTDRDTTEPGAVVLCAKGLSGRGFAGIDLTVRAGEVVGLAGIQGNGQQELLRSLAGLYPSSGTRWVAGRPLRGAHPGAATTAGVAYVPADRHGEGLLLPLSVRENVGIGSIAGYATLGVVNDRRLTSAVHRQVSALAVKTRDIDTRVETLSGGNQQKIVLGRTLLAEPRLLLAEEPTQGVDAGARVEIYQIIRTMADSGTGVVVVSSDGFELAGLCDRVLILSRGHVVRELTGNDVTEHNIAEAALTSTTVRTRAAPRRRATRGGGGARLRRFASGDWISSAVLALAILLLGSFVSTRNPGYLTEVNIRGMLMLLSALAFVSMAQLVVLLIGGIDLSVGPLTGVLVIVVSSIIVEGASAGRTTAGFLVMVAAALAVGALNGVLVRYLRINAVVTTLATFMALRGVALTLRREPAGVIDGTVTANIERSYGFIPIAFVVAVLLAIALEVALRWSRWGVELRAVGSSPEAAGRLGIGVGRIQLLAYAGCSALAVLAGVMLVAQIGIGDPNAGVDYTLSSITAVVLGGASIFGGRGSFIGTLLGAALIQQIINATVFLRLDQSWQYWLVALLTLGAAAGYSKARRIGERP